MALPYPGSSGHTDSEQTQVAQCQFEDILITPDGNGGRWQWRYMALSEI